MKVISQEIIFVFEVESQNYLPKSNRKLAYVLTKIRFDYFSSSNFCYSGMRVICRNHVFSRGLWHATIQLKSTNIYLVKLSSSENIMQCTNHQ